jgi:hypothetical protein
MHEEQERGQIKVAGSTVYVLNDERMPSNLWWASVQAGRDDEGRQLTYEACEAVAQQIAASLAKPQPVGGALTEQAYWQGWCEAADWSGRDDLYADRDSGAYANAMRRRLATLSAPVAQPTGIDWEAEYHGAEAVLTEIRTAMNGSGRWKLGDELVSSIRALIAAAQPALATPITAQPAAAEAFEEWIENHTFEYKHHGDPVRYTENHLREAFFAAPAQPAAAEADAVTYDPQPPGWIQCPECLAGFPLADAIKRAEWPAENPKPAPQAAAVPEAQPAARGADAMDDVLSNLRHLYANMLNGAVRDTASAKRIAIGLLGPAIEDLEKLAAPAQAAAVPEAVEREREACAVVVENFGRWLGTAREEIAAAIRARKAGASDKGETTNDE